MSWILPLGALTRKGISQVPSKNSMRKVTIDAADSKLSKFREESLF